MLGTLSAPYLVQIETDVYSQIGLVMLIGLARKERHPDRRVCQGPLRERQAAGRRRAGGRGNPLAPNPDDVVRIRPGVRAAVDGVAAPVRCARQIMGTTVIGGMLAATCIAIFIVPVLFVTVEKLATKGKGITAVTLVPPLHGAHGDD